jgi:56kDa selenium binding protein (SBP56)
MSRLLDPTFYRSPADAIAAPPERLAYVAAFDPAGQVKDAVTVIDCDPSSPGYGKVAGWTELPTAGNELHHFGWNACSSALCHQGHGVPDLSGREECADLRQQHCQRAGHPGAPFRPQGIEQNCALDWLRHGRWRGTRPVAGPAGREPRLGRLQLRYGGEPPAQLNPRHAPQRWLQRFDNLLANVVTRAEPDKSPGEGAADRPPGDHPWRRRQRTRDRKEQEEL